MKNILTLLLLTTTLSLFGQSDDTWTSFWNSDSTQIGYKDKNGIVKIEAKNYFYTFPNKFDNIMVVMEKVDNSVESYYLTKAGKILGRDSLYFFDNTPDCES